MVLGAVALVPALLGLAVLISMWRAWWLHPLWALLMVPLGVPQISFWQFLALGMFLQGWLSWKTTGDQATTGKKKEWSEIVAGPLVTMFIWPVMTYYFVRWYLS